MFGSVPVASGVSQGSVFGPILFLVFINYLLEKLLSHVRLFDDDAAVFHTVGGSDDGTVLKKTWTNYQCGSPWGTWEFNPFKCLVMRVTTARKAISSVYTFHGQILEVVTSAKYLGVDISSGLSWNSHIDQIT